MFLIFLFVQRRERECPLSRAVFQQWPTDLLGIVYKYSIGYAGCLNTSELTAGPLGRPRQPPSAGDMRQIKAERAYLERKTQGEPKEMASKSESKDYRAICYVST